MALTWETGLELPYAIQMSEDAIGRGTVTAQIDDPVNGSTAALLAVINAPPWLTVLGNGTERLTLSVRFTESPFAYQVHSIDSEGVSHVVDTFLKVPCSQNTWLYERLGNGVIDLPIEVNAGNENMILYVQVTANYSIGRDALQAVIPCQP